MNILLHPWAMAVAHGILGLHYAFEAMRHFLS